MRRIMAVFKLLGVVIAILVVVPLSFVFSRFHPSIERRLAIAFHSVMLWLIGMKVTSSGAPVVSEPVLFISNHASYLDVIVLGSLVDGHFVAKSEVARWPGFGWLAKAGRTVFVDRDKRSQASRQRDTLNARLADGDNLILFPEGTSSDGNRVKHFKSTLLSAAEGPMKDGRLPAVQPVTVAYTGIHGLPMPRRDRPKFSWYGDMELVPHLWDLMQVGPCEATVQFLDPVRASDFPSRKALSNHCRSGIVTALTGLLQGKP